jgi:NADH-quinone oxidoreductase subunit L
LAVLSVVGGLVGIPEILGGHHELHHFLASVLVTEQAHTIEHNTEFAIMAASVIIAALAIVFAILKFSKKPELKDAEGLNKVLANKWYIDELYDTIVVKPLVAIASFLKNIVEKKIIDGSVNNVGKLVNYSARQLRLVQSGQVGNYIMAMILSIVVFILLWFYDASILKLAGKLFH